MSNSKDDPHGWIKLSHSVQSLAAELALNGFSNAAERMKKAVNSFYSNVSLEFVPECWAACRDVVRGEPDLPEDLRKRIENLRDLLDDTLTKSGLILKR